MSDRERGDVEGTVADPPPLEAFGSVISESPAEHLLEASIVASRAARRGQRRTSLGSFLAGWKVACLWAAVTAVAGLAVAEAVAWLGALAGGSTASTATVLRTGGALFLWFHGIGITLSPPAGGFGGPGAAILLTMPAASARSAFQRSPSSSSSVACLRGTLR